MAYSSIIELNQQALRNNIDFLKKYFNDVRLSSVVKSNAYGHGIEPFVQMAQECGIDHFSVFSSGEAREIDRILRSPADIVIMGWIDDTDMDWIIANGIEFFVFEFERIDRFLESAKKLGIPAKIHLEMETGMNRTGFQPSVLPRLIKMLEKNREHFQLKGICTHFAGAESIANYYRITDQIKLFNKIHRNFVKQGLKPEIRHAACSAAAVSYPQTRMDMVRIGILQYGLWPSMETLIHFLKENNLTQDPLRRLLSWKTSIMALKDVNTGEFVGYGTSYLAQEEKKIAIIPTGYATGYARSLSNQGRVLIKGHRVGVIGMVNMNMSVADVSSIPEVAVGDEVVMIGTQGDLTISVASFAEISDQLNYELLTRLPAEIPRIINN